MAAPYKALRALAVAGAGTLAFLAAAHWSRSQAGDRDDSEPVAATRAAPRPPAAATASAVAAANAPTPTPAVTAATTTAATAGTAAVAPAPAAGLRDASLKVPDRAGAIPDVGGDAFAPLTGLPPPPPPPPAADAPPPAAPTAPPLPFTFVGMLERTAGAPQAFLAKGESLLVVSAGDLLDNNTYKVESLGPQQIVLTYLPMNLRQSLNVSGTP